MKEIILMGKKVNYILTRKKVKNINMRIKEDGIVYISANNYIKTEDIEKILIKRADFIVNGIERINKIKKIKDEKTDESKIRYLGEYYDKVIEEGKKEECIVKDNRIIIRVKDKNDNEKIDKVIEKWYDEKAKELFDEINEKTAEIFKAVNVKKAEIKIRKMVSRWGSCSFREGRIRINRYLIEFPRICSEYVFIHEYTHFLYQGHQKNFYDFVKKIMPNYKEVERYLKYNGDLRNKK